MATAAHPTPGPDDVYEYESSETGSDDDMSDFDWQDFEDQENVMGADFKLSGMYGRVGMLVSGIVMFLECAMVIIHALLYVEVWAARASVLINNTDQHCRLLLQLQHGRPAYGHHRDWFALGTRQRRPNVHVVSHALGALCWFNLAHKHCASLAPFVRLAGITVAWR